MKIARRTVGLVLTHAAAIAVSTHALTTRAESVPTVPYRLVEGSTYQEGCFDPCDCPLLQEQPMTGTFDLVFHPFMGPLWTVAVESVDWSVPALGKQLVGQGLYRRAGEMHQLQLDLQIDGASPVAFDSGWVAGGDSYPTIDITLSMNGLYCYDVALHVLAEPADEVPYLAVDREQLSWSAAPDGPAFDVLCGDLMALRAGGGDFGPAVDACLADDLLDTTLPQDVTVAPGYAVWFLVGRQGGSFDSGGAAQVGSRDAEIASSPLACP